MGGASTSNSSGPAGGVPAAGGCVAFGGVCVLSQAVFNSELPEELIDFTQDISFSEFTCEDSTHP